MEGKFIEADITAISTNGIGIGGKGEDPGAIVEFDIADFEFFGEGGGMIIMEDGKLKVVGAIRDNGFGVVKELAEVEAGLDIFESGGLIFGSEEVVAAGEVEAFEDVFEGIGEGPADADGFFGQTEAGTVVDPGVLVGEKGHGDGKYLTLQISDFRGGIRLVGHIGRFGRIGRAGQNFRGRI
jgi:hypothetical protein